MRRRVVMKVVFRPILSPRWPKRAAPTGLTTKHEANISQVKREAAMGSSWGKKRREMKGEREAYEKNSYHSINVPAVGAVTTILMLLWVIYRVKERIYIC
jgi:hypothetical protein